MPGIICDSFFSRLITRGGVTRRSSRLASLRLLQSYAHGMLETLGSPLVPNMFTSFRYSDDRRSRFIFRHVAVSRTRSYLVLKKFHRANLLRDVASAHRSSSASAATLFRLWYDAVYATRSMTAVHHSYLVLLATPAGRVSKQQSLILLPPPILICRCDWWCWCFLCCCWC